MGIQDRVRGFLDSWPMIKEELEELTSNATVTLPEEEGEG